MSQGTLNLAHWEHAPEGRGHVEMTAGQYARALGELGMSHRKAAKVFCIMRRQSRMMEKGLMRVPGPVARLIAIMYVYGITPEQVLEVAERIGGNEE